MTGSEVTVIGLAKHIGSLLDRTASLCQTTFVDGELVPARIDRITQSLHAQLHQFLGYCVQPFADVVELTRHRDLRFVSSLVVAADRSSQR